MSSLLETLSHQIDDDKVKRISSQLGTDEHTTRQAISAALPLLINALARNASSHEGANALSKALYRDHDGGILDDLSGFLGNPGQGPGGAILRHVLGPQRQRVEAGLGRSSGLDMQTISKLLVMLAPIVMGALGRANRKNQMDEQHLSGYLRREREQMEPAEPGAMRVLGGLLDTDNDGDLDVSDLARHGAGLLGKFLRK